MTDKTENIINTIRHYRKLLSNSTPYSEDYKIYICKLGGLLEGLNLVLEEEEVSQLYNFAMKLNENR